MQATETYSYALPVDVRALEQRADEVEWLLQRSGRTFDAICILDWYDGILSALVLKHDIELALLLTAKYSCHLGYLFEVAEMSHAGTLKLLQKECREWQRPNGERDFDCRDECPELEMLIQQAQPLGFLLEIRNSARLGGRFAIRQVWGNRVPWYR